MIHFIANSLPVAGVVLASIAVIISARDLRRALRLRAAILASARAS